MKKELKDKLYNITFAILSVAILLIVSFLTFIITEKEKAIFEKIFANNVPLPTILV